MNTSKLLASAFLAAALIGAGCTTTSTRVDAPQSPVELPAEPEIDSHYEPIILRGSDYIDALRAHPAPELPAVVEGKSELGDQRELAAQGFVRIGNGRYALRDEATLAEAVRLGQEVGADQMLLYSLQRTGEAESESGRFLVAYYVRFRLLFGATFRNLTASERERLGTDSGVRIGSVVGDTPASQANLMAGDYVLAFNGQAITDRTGFQKQLLDAAGKSVSLKVLRGNLTMNRIIRLGASPTTNPTP